MGAREIGTGVDSGDGYNCYIRRRVLSPITGIQDVKLKLTPEMSGCQHRTQYESNSNVPNNGAPEDTTCP